MTMKRYFRVERRDMAYLKFTIEAYEGVATLTTLEPREGIVRVLIPPGMEEEADLMLQALRGEVPMTEIPRPEGLPDPLEE